MERHSRWGLVLFSIIFCLFVTSCDTQEEPPPGPAEQLGRELDKTMLGAVKKAQEVQKQLGEKFEHIDQAREKSDQEER